MPEVKQKTETVKEEVDEKSLTWQQKLEKGLKLTSLEETKADADFNFKRRQRELDEKKAFEAAKAGNKKGE